MLIADDWLRNGTLCFVEVDVGIDDERGEEEAEDEPNRDMPQPFDDAQREGPEDSRNEWGDVTAHRPGHGRPRNQPP